MPVTAWITRAEAAADVAAIRDVNLQAFGNDYEPDVIEKLRADPASWLPGLSIVATTEDGKVVGPRPAQPLPHRRDARSSTRTLRCSPRLSEARRRQCCHPYCAGGGAGSGRAPRRAAGSSRVLPTFRLQACLDLRDRRHLRDRPPLDGAPPRRHSCSVRHDPLPAALEPLNQPSVYKPPSLSLHQRSVSGETRGLRRPAGRHPPRAISEPIS